MYEEVSVFSYITRSSFENSISMLVKLDNTYVGFFTIDSDNDLFITYEENSEYDKDLVIDVIKSHILNEIIDGITKYINVNKQYYRNISPDAYRNLRKFIKDYDIKTLPFNDNNINNLDFTCIYITY